MIQSQTGEFDIPSEDTLGERILRVLRQDPDKIILKGATGFPWK